MSGMFFLGHSAVNSSLPPLAAEMKSAQVESDAIYYD